MKRRAYLAVFSGGLASLAGCTESLSNRRPIDKVRTPSSTTTYSEDVTPYENLSDEGQLLFKDILEAGHITVPVSELPSSLSEAEYVRYEGTVYSVHQRQTHQYVSEYSFSTSKVEKPAIEDKSALVAFEQLFSEAQDVFKAAQTEGRYTTRDSLPDQVIEHRYVMYQDTYYNLQVSVGDIPIWKLSASKAETR